MIIIQMSGGLGNQLNIYAFYLKMKSIGKNAKIDCCLYKSAGLKGGGEVDRNFELDKLGLKYDECSVKEHEKYIDDNNSIINKIRRAVFGRHDNVIESNKCKDLLKLDDGYICGQFNPAIYSTSDILENIINNIHFEESIDERNISTLEDISKNHSVAIHIRRTDYLEQQNSYLNIATDEYYQTAISYMQEHIDNPVFYVFSDDKEYISKTFNEDNYKIVDWNSGANSIYDLQLMSKCKHNITANSTFSHWAARLNNNPNKIIITPIEKEKILFERDKNFLCINQDGVLQNER